MALVKFNKSANKQTAAAAISDNTVYFPTDEQAVYLNGRKMGEANTVTSVNGKTGAVTIEVPVTSVNGKTGAVTLGKSDVGLGNVDNTADSNKSVAYATKIGSNSSHPQVGSATQPVYVNSEGTITAGTALEDAAYKDVVTTLDSSGKLPTSGAVKTYVDNVIKAVDGDVMLVGRVSGNTGKVTFINSIAQPDMPYKDFLNLDPDTYTWMKSGLMLVVTSSGTLIEDEWEEGGETKTKTAEVEEGDQILIFEYGSDSHPMWTPIYIQRNVDKATANILGLVKVPSANGLSVNSTGAIQLAEASTSAAGAMSSADKTKLNALPTNAELTTALSGKKNTQTAKTSPSASGNTTSFIDTITQDAQGVITATKKTVPDAAVASSGSNHTKGLITAEMIDALVWH